MSKDAARAHAELDAVCGCGHCDDCWLLSLVTAAIGDPVASRSAWRLLTRRDEAPADRPAVRLVAPGEAPPGTISATTRRLRALCELAELVEYEKARAVVAAGNEGIEPEDTAVLLGTGLGYVVRTLARIDAALGRPGSRPGSRHNSPSAGRPRGRHCLELVDAVPSDGLDALASVGLEDGVGPPGAGRHATGRHVVGREVVRDGRFGRHRAAGPEPEVEPEALAGAQ